MARNVFVLLLVLLIVCIMQVLGFSRLTLFHTAPDALAVFLGFSAVTLGRNAGTGFGFLGGMLCGILTGDIGLHMLAGTTGGFIAGSFHIPRDSHATPSQKMRRIYGATASAAFVSHTVLAIGLNPLGLSPVYRIVVLGLLATLFTLMLAFVSNLLILKNTISD
ncbi:MAG: rod shape-determining protein MreD [Pelodictyon luteolum]|uniref:Rod shape-determining protein MreD n=1 Tax=Pelodictyon luteolum TaxID=1100 RepID=A0A165LBA9_PELLU|nr:rod shape-determining protein MreD [Pelodictyon luteolum]KZK73813.1 MAG: rod shape-determining protein MreD [Pelodictyon luteolum]